MSGHPYRTAELALVRPAGVPASTRIKCFLGMHGRAIGRIGLSSVADVTPLCEHCSAFVLVGVIERDARGPLWCGRGAAIDFDDATREWLRGRRTFEMLVQPPSERGPAWGVTVHTPDDLYAPSRPALASGDRTPEE